MLNDIHRFIAVFERSLRLLVYVDLHVTRIKNDRIYGCKNFDAVFCRH